MSGTVLLVPVGPLFLKHPQPYVRTIEHVVNQAACVCSFRSSHPHKLPNPRHFINKPFLTPLFHSLYTHLQSVNSSANF